MIKQLTLAVILLGSVVCASAQQTVFNVPTEDILDKGRVYFELDMSFKMNNQETLRKFSSFVPRVVIGAGKNIEVGLNLTGNVQPGIDATTLVPSIKWRFYKNEKNGMAFFVGNNFYIPLRNKSYNFGSYTYISAAKTIDNTRLTAGGFVFSKNVVAQNATRGGGQFAVEQTITPKLTVSADWITGKHANGYLTTGASYKLTKRLTGVASYAFGNANLSRGNHYIYLELGYSFNLGQH